MEKFWTWVAKKALMNEVACKYCKEQLRQDFLVEMESTIAVKDARIAALSRVVDDLKNKVVEMTEGLKDIKNVNLEKTAASGKIVKKRKYTKKKKQE